MRPFLLMMASLVSLNSAALAGDALVNHRFTPQSSAAQSEQREELDRWRKIQALQARREREEMDRWRRIQARQARREQEEIDRWRRLQTRREREAQQGVHAHTSEPAS